MIRAVRFGSWDIPGVARTEGRRTKRRRTLAAVVGADGGFDHYGDADWPLGVGNCEVGFTLMGDSPTDFDTRFDAMITALTAGRQKLYVVDSLGSERWAWAKPDQLPDVARAHYHVQHQPVTLTFILSEPYWYADRDPVTQVCDETPEDWTVTNGGTATNLRPIITIKATGAADFNQPRIQNLTTGEELRIMCPAVANNHWVQVDAGARTCRGTKDGGSNWFDLWHTLVLPATQGGIMSIAPGANSFRLQDYGVTPDCTVVVDFEDCYVL